MGILQEAGVQLVSHYTPLHYLPFIARSSALRSKPALKAKGFNDSHFRSKSRLHDVGRGFGEYAFLTLDSSPRIVKAKLAAGFPHVALLVPASAVEAAGFDLSRFNVAMTRVLRRHGKPGRAESPSNGRYYGNKQIPIARSDADRAALLACHLGQTMIEVLVRHELPLPSNTSVVAYHASDLDAAQKILAAVKSPWQASLSEAPGPYPRDARHVANVEAFVNHALLDEAWLGDGLEYDNL